MRATVSFFAVMLLPLVAAAHGLDLEAHTRGDRIAVAAYFDDNAPAAGASVTVEDAAGGVVAEGKLDGQGNWSFPTPGPGRYRVTVNAGDGHLTRRTITVADAGPLSDGPTRDEFTGLMRWAYTAVGLVAIAGLTVGTRALLRRRTR